MNRKEELVQQGKDEFFFRYNLPINQGGPAIVFCSSLFWMIINEIRDDCWMLHATGAFWAMIILMVLSVGIILFDGYLNRKPGFSDRETFQWRLSSMIYNLVLFTAVGMIIGAGNLHSMLTGTEPAAFGISLASVLLFVPVIAAMPANKCAFVLLGITIATLFIPYMMPGSEMYNIVPETVLRVGLAATYIVVRRRINNSYELQCDYIKLNDEMEESNEDVMDLLINAVEIRDTGSGEHVKKVRKFTRLLAEEMMESYPEYNLTPGNVDVIVRASAMHDIGKIMISDEILLKPGKLTEEEFEIMKTHSRKGYDMLKQAPKSWGEDLIRFSKEICLYHHEKYDGRGYPAGLVGDEIPICAQIVSVADCYEALISQRSYKAPYSPEKAFDMIISGECGAFSEKIKTALVKKKNDFREAVD